MQSQAIVKSIKDNQQSFTFDPDVVSIFKWNLKSATKSLKHTLCGVLFAKFKRSKQSKLKNKVL